MSDPAAGPVADLGLFGSLPPSDPGRRRFAKDIVDWDRRRLEELWRGRSKHPLECPAPGCKTRLAWYLTERGRWMPVAAIPDPAGNVVVVERGCAQLVRFVRSDDPAQAEQTRYKPHFHKRAK